MKLVDKMILLTCMEQNNNDYELDVVADIQRQHSFYQDQKRHLKDKSLYEQGQSILEEIEQLHYKYNENHKQIKNKLSGLLRDEEVNILRKNYGRFEATVLV